MPLLSQKDREHLLNKFKTLENPVKIILFTQEIECRFCRETHEIVGEVANLSDKISTEIYDFVADREIAEQYDIDKIPGIVIARGGEQPKNYGIRYFGIPSGYEFSSLIYDIIMVSTGNSELSDESKSWLTSLTEPVHLQVFVTPTCPYCPQAVLLAHRLAFESDLVTADMVEATEFPHLSQKYQVMGVPRTVVNETIFQEGAVPEALLLTKLQEAVELLLQTA